jgi:hypothetical protein
MTVLVLSQLSLLDSQYFDSIAFKTFVRQWILIVMIKTK